MSRLVAIYHAYLKLAWLKQLQYRTELLIWLISRVLEPIIYLVVWTAVAHTNGGAVEGLTTGDFAAYFIAEMLVTSATYTALMCEYEYRVRNGTLSRMLLQPVHPIHADLAECLAGKALTVLVLLPVAGFLVIAFRPTFHLVPWSIFLFLPTLCLAFALRFVMEWVLAMAAFWTTRVMAVNSLYFGALLLFSGELAPLALLPMPMHTLALLLPFRWVVTFPIEMLLGRLTPQDVVIGFAVLTFWLVCMVALFMQVWHVGVRRYAGVGT
jgi:ABC-2 type transport system permease protein